MKNYKHKSKIYIGNSDYASLILAGYMNNKGLTLQELHFYCDGDYWAYELDETYSIPQHYSLIAEYHGWMKIYDDEELTKHYKGNIIRVYRAGEFGVIIQVIN